MSPPAGLPANTDVVEYTFAKAAQTYQTTVRFRAHGVSPAYQLQTSPGAALTSSHPLRTCLHWNDILLSMQLQVIPILLPAS